jgi:hypothetical protein
MLTELKRKKNEKEFQFWDDDGDKGRKYWFEVSGRNGWKARYVKEVDEKEDTICFYRKFITKKMN